jgi:ubiquinone/menaquinone biosynthesis C-methylase UbiE
MLIAARILGAAIVAGLSLPVTASAQLASRPVEEWVKVLDAQDRLAGLKTDEVIARLALKPGSVVADLGAGAGPFVVPFARAVSPTGKVYAVEVDRDFFPYIEKRAKAAGASNVVTVGGEFTDPRLPAADVDLAFLHDVLHHIEGRAAYLKAVAKYLKPGGRIAIIDYHPDQSPHREQPALQVSKDQAAAWLAFAGFKPIEEVPLFADKWFVVFGRAGQ